MKKIYKQLMVAAPIVVTVVSVGTYFAVTTFNDQKEIKNEKSIVHHVGMNKDIDLKIFPKLDQSKFYKYIRIKDNKPYLTDEFIARVINEVLQKMQFSGGQIRWGYEFRDTFKKDDLLVNFEWVPSKESSVQDVQKKSYHFKLINS